MIIFFEKTRIAFLIFENEFLKAGEINARKSMIFDGFSKGTHLKPYWKSIGNQWFSSINSLNFEELVLENEKSNSRFLKKIDHPLSNPKTYPKRSF